MRSYKLFGLFAAVVFAVTGLFFLFFPDLIQVVLNGISARVGLPRSPAEGYGLYLVLTSAYMYLVTILAYLMYRYPEQKIYPLLLANGKLASSIVSILLFLLQKPYLIYILDFITDGAIGLAVLYLMKRKQPKTG